MQNQTAYHVYLTHDTMRGIMLEKARHPGLECIVQMPGVRHGNDFYFDMAADSGINATYRYAMCEKDHVYADHLSTRLAEYYDFPPDLLTVSQIHFHPAEFQRFSTGDGPANRKLAQQFGGVVNGLMWVDPTFRVQFWYIDENGNETPVDYTIDDAAVANAMPRKSLEKLKKLIESNEVRMVSTKTEIVAVPVDDREGKVPRIDPDNRTVRSKIAEFYRKIHKGKERKPMDYMMHKNKEPGVYSCDMEDTLDFESMCATLRPYTILLPEEYRDQRYEGPLRGYYIEDTKTFNVVPVSLADVRGDTRLLGEARRIPSAEEDAKQELLVLWQNESPSITVNGVLQTDVVLDFYSLRKEVFSRNQGILEYTQMADKQAIIAGLGSGGFFMGLELVKAGIGSIIAADDDCLSYHNVCRHVCGIHDVGQYKVDLFRKYAADINPECKVYTFRDLLQHMDPAALEEAIWEKSIILGCADNRHAGYVCNELADRYHIPMVDAGCGPRASSGEVFYYKPDTGMACYTCAYGEDTGVDHSNQNVRRQFYATEAELEKLHFQPGMSMDIELTAIFATKLAIDLLMEGEPNYQAKLLPYINQCTVLLNYPVGKDVNPYMQLFEKQRPMTWKTGPAVRNPRCSNCQV